MILCFDVYCDVSMCAAVTCTSCVFCCMCCVFVLLLVSSVLVGVAVLLCVCWLTWASTVVISAWLLFVCCCLILVYVVVCLPVGVLCVLYCEWLWCCVSG